jgi:hypothetical protein
VVGLALGTETETQFNAETDAVSVSDSFADGCGSVCDTCFAISVVLSVDVLRCTVCLHIACFTGGSKGAWTASLCS